MSSTTLTLVFAGFLLASLLVRLWLASRQIRHVALHRDAVPAAFTATVSLAAHQRAADYTLAKLRFGLVSLALGSAVLLGWTLLGGLDALNGWLLAAAQPALGDLGYQLALLAAFAVIGGLIELPMDAWSTFRLEACHGFNRMTPALWLADQAKGVAVAVLLGGPIALLILWLMGAAGPSWWLWAWGAWVGFNLAVLVLYPTVIAPLFAGLSRKQEFEADAYACRHTSASDLRGALLKLYEDNASTLTPDRLYVCFYYSHPPAGERLAAMGALA